MSNEAWISLANNFRVFAETDRFYGVQTDMFQYINYDCDDNGRVTRCFDGGVLAQITTYDAGTYLITGRGVGDSEPEILGYIGDGYDYYFEFYREVPTPSTYTITVTDLTHNLSEVITRATRRYAYSNFGPYYADFGDEGVCSVYGTLLSASTSLNYITTTTTGPNGFYISYSSNSWNFNFPVIQDGTGGNVIQGTCYESVSLTDYFRVTMKSPLGVVKEIDIPFVRLPLLPTVITGYNGVYPAKHPSVFLGYHGIQT
jgi:hypothetical protein